MTTVRTLIAAAVAAVAIAGASAPALASHAPPTKIETISRIAPDLFHREIARAKPSWAHLREMAASRWEKTHPAARAAHRRQEARRAFAREAHRYYAEFSCIARHESSSTWDISTGNGYYGGLQMDQGFAQTYGPKFYAAKGTPDHWTEDEQRWAAVQAVATRGFTPWPNTARMCGLI